MEFMEALKFRHACKEFDSNKKISEKDFDFILECARLSPSSFGLEPWKILVVQSEEKREKLAPFTWGAKNQLPTASHFLIVLAKKQREIKYDSAYVEHIMKDIKKLGNETLEAYRERLRKFQTQEFRVLDNERNSFDWASKQSYIAMANMMTGAATLGIDSCPIEGFDPKEADRVIKEEFFIDTESMGVSYMLAFGYRKNIQPEKTREELNSKVSYF